MGKFLIPDVLDLIPNTRPTKERIEDLLRLPSDLELVACEVFYDVREYGWLVVSYKLAKKDT